MPCRSSSAAVRGPRPPPRLRELAEQIQKVRPLVTPAEQANRAAFRAPPLLTDVRMDGGSAADQALVRRIFAPLVGKPADRAQVRKAIDAAYATGRFDLVTFDLSRRARPAPDRGRAKQRGWSALFPIPPRTTPCSWEKTSARFLPRSPTMPSQLTRGPC